MVTTKVITGLLNHVKDVTLSQFSIENYFVYDPNLDFSERAKQYISRQGIFQTLEGEVPDTWAIIVWSRSGIEKPPQTMRQHRVPLSSTNDLQNLDSESEMRVGQISIDFKIITNNMEYAEDIEETLYVRAGESIDFEADYGATFGLHRCASEAEAPTSFETVDIESHGSVTAVATTFNVSYPVYLPVTSAKNILDIIEDIHSYNENGDTLMDTQTIVP